MNIDVVKLINQNSDSKLCISLGISKWIDKSYVRN